MTAGIVAASFISLLKLCTEALLYTIRNGPNELIEEKWFFTCVVLALFSVWVFRIRLISKTLKYYHHSLFMPLYQSTSLSMTAAFGIIYFNEFSENRQLAVHASLLQYSLGLTLVTIGSGLKATRFNPYTHSLDRKLFSEESSQLLNVNGDSEIAMSDGLSKGYDFEYNTGATGGMLYDEEAGQQGGDHSRSSRLDDADRDRVRGVGTKEPWDKVSRQYTPNGTPARSKSGRSGDDMSNLDRGTPGTPTSRREQGAAAVGRTANMISSPNGNGSVGYGTGTSNYDGSTNSRMDDDQEGVYSQESDVRRTGAGTGRARGRGVTGSGRTY